MSKKIDSRKFAEWLEDTHTLTLRKTHEFQDVLTHLRFEGRPFYGKNLRHLRELLGFFEKTLVPHLKLEEDVIFPFLEVHVPKLESLIHLLQWEHEDLKKTAENFRLEFRELSQKKSDSARGKMIEKISQTGTYLIYLLRHHIQAENRGVYRVIDRELRRDEKEELAQRIRRR